MAKALDVTNLKFNPYEYLGLPDHNVTEKEIIRAFRKKALEWHPDKNRTREEEAKSMFQKISKAFEILSDKGAKAAFDRLLKARKAAEERRGLQDEKRRKLREQLEAREQGIRSEQEEEIFAAKRVEEEIARLRKEGSSLLQRERENIEREVHRDPPSSYTPSTSHPTVNQDKFIPRLKLKWKSSKTDPQNGGYSSELLREMFCKYGTVSALIMSKSKKGSALLEFEDVVSATSALNFEKGLVDNEVSISWVQPPPQINTQGAFVETAPDEDRSGMDFESLVLRRLRQAEERKKLIEQMIDEETE